MLMSPQTLGITPAYAGTTDFDFATPVVSEDHPRLRGDYENYIYGNSDGTGSPPLTRGLQYEPIT